MTDGERVGAYSTMHSYNTAKVNQFKLLSSPAYPDFCRIRKLQSLLSSLWPWVVKRGEAEAEAEFSVSLPMTKSVSSKTKQQKRQKINCIPPERQTWGQTPPDWGQRYEWRSMWSKDAPRYPTYRNCPTIQRQRERERERGRLIRDVGFQPFVRLSAGDKCNYSQVHRH